MRRSLQKICLISPHRNIWARTERISQILNDSYRFLKAWYSPPLSLLTIAAHTPSRVQIEVVQEDFSKIDYAAAYDLVGITAMIQNAERAYEIAAEFRTRGTYVVIGGIHATVLPEEAAVHADTVIAGEAEQLWPRFLKDFEHGEPQKIYRNSSEAHIDLTASPVPRYDLLNPQESQLDPHYYYNFVPIQVSRGCPHDCDFCLVSEIYGRKHRRKTLAQVRTELLTIKRYLPNRLIGFVDDNLFIDRRFARDLLLTLAELKVRWIGQADVAVGEDSELLQLMYRSGCLFLLIGFESLDPENLSGINQNKWKLRQLESYERYIRNIQEHGIMVYGAFIFGFDHDDAGVFARVVEFMNRNKITGQLTFATPLPGSRMYDRLKRERRFLYPEPFWDRCTFFDVIFKLKRMTKEEAEEGFIWAYQQLFNEAAVRDRAAYFKEIYKKLN
jgi:radical SAM superfamily enzyme YgiQ (UPF0313 family)